MAVLLKHRHRGLAVLVRSYRSVFCVQASRGTAQGVYNRGPEFSFSRAAPAHV
jgi:hypothetical protein